MMGRWTQTQLPPAWQAHEWGQGSGTCMHQAATTQHQHQQKHESPWQFGHKGTCSAHPMPLQADVCAYTHTETSLPGGAPRRLACLPVTVLSQQALHHWQRKSKGFAAACLGACREVCALHGWAQHQVLDGEQGLDAATLQGTHDLCWCECGGNRGRRQQQQQA